MPRACRPDSELKQLAIDIHAGRVFGSWNIPYADTVSLHFIPLAMLDPAMIDVLQVEGAVQFYEYMDKAAPRSINGAPCFFSFHTLTQEEAEKVEGFCRKIEAALRSI